MVSLVATMLAAKTRADRISLYPKVAPIPNGVLISNFGLMVPVNIKRKIAKIKNRSKARTTPVFEARFNCLLVRADRAISSVDPARVAPQRIEI
jgi:hypothetical protein